MGRHQRIASAVLVAAASLVIPAAAAALPFTPQLTATLQLLRSQLPRIAAENGVV